MLANSQILHDSQLLVLQYAQERISAERFSVFYELVTSPPPGRAVAEALPHMMYFYNIGMLDVPQWYSYFNKETDIVLWTREAATASANIDNPATTIDEEACRVADIHHSQSVPGSGRRFDHHYIDALFSEGQNDMPEGQVWESQEHRGPLHLSNTGQGSGNQINSTALAHPGPKLSTGYSAKEKGKGRETVQENRETPSYPSDTMERSETQEQTPDQSPASSTPTETGQSSSSPGLEDTWKPKVRNLGPPLMVRTARWLEMKPYERKIFRKFGTLGLDEYRREVARAAPMP